MTITLYTLTTAVLWSDVFILALCIIRRSNWLIEAFGVKALSFLIAGCVFRLVLPIEFPFTKVIMAPNVWNPVNDFFFAPVTAEAPFVTVFLVFIIVWVLIAAILLCRLIFSYLRYARLIARLPSTETAQLMRTLEHVIPEKGRGHIRIVLGSSQAVPQMIGFFHGTVLLPDMDYTDEELYYILKHEYAHFRGRDSWIKLLVSVFCCAFWWNPFVYLLKVDLETVLELKCDLWVTADGQSVLPYMDTMMHVIEKSGSKCGKIPFTTSELARDQDMIQRFLLMRGRGEKNKRKQKVVSVTFVVFLLSALALSYFFVPQPAYNPVSSEFSTQEVTENETYIQSNGDGTYTIFVDGKSANTIDEETKAIMELDGFTVIDQN